MNELIQDIRKRCRMQMDGIASASMRKKGLAYKLNFGVPVQEIKTIAKRYEASTELAEKLWADETRELKILATLLYPIHLYKQDIANRWVGEIPNQEIREQVVFNLFQNLSFASSLVESWLQADDASIRSTGYWLAARLIMTKKIDKTLDLALYSFVWDDVVSDNFSTRNAAILFLKNVGRLSESMSTCILQKLAPLKSSDRETDKAVYDSLAFEFEYLYN